MDVVAAAAANARRPAHGGEGGAAPLLPRAHQWSICKVTDDTSDVPAIKYPSSTPSALPAAGGRSRRAHDPGRVAAAGARRKACRDLEGGGGLAATSRAFLRGAAAAAAASSPPPPLLMLLLCLRIIGAPYRRRIAAWTASMPENVSRSLATNPDRTQTRPRPLGPCMMASSSWSSGLAKDSRYHRRSMRSTEAWRMKYSMASTFFFWGGACVFFARQKRRKNTPCCTGGRAPPRSRSAS